ncbi:MAG: hypothetical protein WC476_01590 [Phycisphaerae bacterium]|jgi:hypothetical protein
MKVYVVIKTDLFEGIYGITSIHATIEGAMKKAKKEIKIEANNWIHIFEDEDEGEDKGDIKKSAKGIKELERKGTFKGGYRYEETGAGFEVWEWGLRK